MTGRHSSWRVNMLLDPEYQIFCEVWGMEPSDLVRHALRVMSEKTVGPWHNPQTWAMAHYIQNDPDWRKLAEASDDFDEFVKTARYHGIEETPKAGIPFSSRSVARKRLSPLIRSIVKDKEK